MPFFVEPLVKRSVQEDQLSLALYLSDPIPNGMTTKRRVDLVHSCKVILYREGIETPPEGPPALTAVENGSGLYQVTIPAEDRPNEGEVFMLSVTVQDTENSVPQICEGMRAIAGPYTLMAPLF